MKPSVFETQWKMMSNIKSHNGTEISHKGMLMDDSYLKRQGHLHQLRQQFGERKRESELAVPTLMTMDDEAEGEDRSIWTGGSEQLSGERPGRGRALQRSSMSMMHTDLEVVQEYGDFSKLQKVTKEDIDEGFNRKALAQAG
jgi:hypothetical protein